jgi:hypothetical protein
VLRCLWKEALGYTRKQAEQSTPGQLLASQETGHRSAELTVRCTRGIFFFFPPSVKWANSSQILPKDPALPLLGIYPKDSPTYNKDTCSTIFIAALFIIVRNWEEPTCPPTEE